jgi:hypothetical protein
LARPGAFKSEKRKKELMRQKKQENKRKKRLGIGSGGGEEVPEGGEPVECLPSEEAVETNEIKENAD